MVRRRKLCWLRHADTMIEWNRLVDISTSTRMYLAKPESQSMNIDAPAKLAKIHFAKRRHERQLSAGSSIQEGDERWDRPSSMSAIPPPSNPLAVELPAEDVGSYGYQSTGQRPVYKHTPSMAAMKYTVVSSDEYPQPMDSTQTQQLPFRPSTDSARRSDESSTNRSPQHRSPRQSTDHIYQYQGSPPRAIPPPLPPKTPLPYPDEQSPRTFTNMGNLGRFPSSAGGGLPYPDTDAPPPVVNVSTKPSLGQR